MKRSPIFYVWGQIASILDEKVLDRQFFDSDDIDIVNDDIHKKISNLFPDYFSSDDADSMDSYLREEIHILENET